MLIIKANTPEHAHIALRTDGEHIVALAPNLTPEPGEIVFDAAGGAMLPGLHDHHLHLLAYAAAIDSVHCGPPQLDCAQALAATLATVNTNSEGWIRGFGYHESVAGDIDRYWLDRVVPGRPVRIQHRSGQLWIFNSLGLQCLGVDDACGIDPFERLDGKPTGRLYGADSWIRERLGASMPALGEASRRLARLGITGVTDASPGNGLAEFRHFAAESEAGRLQQNVLVMGSEALDPSWTAPGLSVGATKIHLREASLPSFDALCDRIEHSHRTGRPVAVHCVTLVELMLAVTALQTAGVQTGDRLEHAALATMEAVDLVREAGLHVVTQPNFIFERGDNYLASLPAEDLQGLYRTGSFAAAGVAVGAGSDAPYGDPDPWRAIAVALDRRTRTGRVLGAAEGLTPDSVLDLYCSDPQYPGGTRRSLEVGGVADLCVLDRPLARVFADAAAVNVRLTISRGRVVHCA
ncbi:MAG: amidohydrolase family protein [Proteobacteria bacterium]|nr:amidohydrolase family protein [Pseudomonadota bacterium]MBS0611052.1 amidohydrolase family protein [Pseudomonadota bacterium]